MVSSFSALSVFSLTITLPGELAEKTRWWRDFMSLNAWRLKKGVKYSDQFIGVLLKVRHQLGMVNDCRTIHHPCNVCQTSHIGTSKGLLHQAETPIRCKFGVSNQHEGDFYCLIESSKNTPC